jgi:hypothetical protein
MGKRITTNAVATRVVYHPDPATRPDAPMRLYTHAQLAAKRREQARQVAIWQARQAVLIERDRRMRRFWLGFGAVVALALLAVAAVVIWLVWQALTNLTLGAVAVPLGVVAIVAGLAVGHRCVTIVQHWH